MKKWLLNIPYKDKDEAKFIAKNNHCALFFLSDKKIWECNGKELPKELEKFLISKNENENEKQEKYHFVLDIPFELKGLAQQNGCKWDSENKVFIYYGVDVPILFKDYVCQAYSYESMIEKELNKNIRTNLIPNITKNTITPRDYQLEAKNIISKAYFKKFNGFLLADEVGLGKTISSIIFAQEHKFKSILIVTTLSAVPHWRSTLFKFEMNGVEIIVINYDRLQKLFDFDSSKYKTKAKTKKLKIKEWQIQD